MVINLCRFFHCLPSQLMAEDASILRLVKVYEMGNPEPDDDSGEEV